LKSRVYLGKGREKIKVVVMAMTHIHSNYVKIGLDSPTG